MCEKNNSARTLPALPTALARAFGSLAKPADCCARRTVEGDVGQPGDFVGAKMLRFCASVALVCMLHDWERDVACSCISEQGEPMVGFAACMQVGRGWVMRENASPAPRFGLGLLCAPLCVAQCMDMAGSRYDVYIWQVATFRIPYISKFIFLKLV